MRDRLRRYNMKTLIVRARFVAKAPNGSVLLKHVMGPGNEYLSHHLWIKASHWNATHHEPGDSIAVRARVEPYFRKDPDDPKDYSLFYCQEWFPPVEAITMHSLGF